MCIRDRKKIDLSQSNRNSPQEDLFRFYFNQPRQREYKSSAIGSGVILDAKNGYIITNNHVVEDADEITVRLLDKSEYEASVIGKDPKSDLAVIKIKAKNFFEIGTGRGTASYAVSLSESVDSISTIDIIPFEQKRIEAIGYEQAQVSNSDLYDLIKFPEKSKINFRERSQFVEVLKNKPENGYDLFFIDGNHTDFDVIKEDYLMCSLMAAENAVFEKCETKKHVVF